MTPDEMRDRARKALADDAEQLQSQINEFIDNATICRVDLPAALYDANAELLLLPARLRDPATSAANSSLNRPNRGSGRARRRLRLLGR